MTSRDPGSGETISSPFVYQGIHSRTKNVILFGESGAGKSSIINLMAGRDVAKVSSSVREVTLHATPYLFTLSRSEIPFRVFDTVGLQEAEMDFDASLGIVDKARELVTTLYSSGGIDLLLLCVRGGRVTATMQKNYRLFFEFLCNRKVPIAVVVTYLENEDVMDNWWTRNAEALEYYDIRPISHACITAVPARVSFYAEKRIQSRNVLENLFVSTLNGRGSHYVKSPQHWMTTFTRGLLSSAWSILPFKRARIATALQERCGFSAQEAQGLAEVIARLNA